MKRILGVMAAAMLLAACQTTSGSAPGLATNAFDYVPSRDASRPDTHFGYAITGGSGLDATLEYEERGSRIDVVFELSATGVSEEAVLDIEMPYLSDGVRRFTGETDDGLDVFVQLQAGPCGSASHFATIVVGPRRFSGCAREDAAADRWSNYLASWMPAIDLCSAEMRGQADHVTMVYATTNGTAVRMASEAGSRYECITLNDQRVNAVRSLSAADVMTGEADPIFIRSNMPENGYNCYVFESVRDAAGQLIGAFGYDSCAGPREGIS